MLKKLLLAAWLLALATTTFAQGTLVWEENFDAGTNLPTGWAQTTAASDGGWKIGTPSFLSSTSFPVPTRAGNIIGTNDDKCNCVKTNEILTFPVLDLTSYSNLFLLCDLFYVDGTYQGNKETLKLRATIDGGTTWTDVKTFSGAGVWQNKVNVDISAFGGQAAVQFAFRYDDGNGWLYGAMIDNIQIVIPDNVIRASLTNVTGGKYIGAVPTILSNYTKIMAGHEVAVGGTINNVGFPTITSFDVFVTRGGVTTDTFNFINQNIGFAKSSNFIFSYPTVLGANTFNFNVEIGNVNDVGDNDPADNTGAANYSVLGVEAQPGRKVVVEEGTGTWCTWCPRGAVMMDHIADYYHDQAVPIAVHNSTSDPMRVAAYDAGMVSLIAGFPGGLVERVADIDPLLGTPNFEISLIERLTQPARILVSQNVEWNSTLRKVDVTSSLQFMEEINGDLRIAVVFTEDGVKGTSSGYNQVNAYSGGARGPMGGFENLPSPVPAAQMVYNHVARGLVGGFTGSAGSVPATNPAGSVMSYTSTYIVPGSYNIDNMQAVTMVIDNGTGQIINAESTPIPFVSTAAPVKPETTVSVSIAPNPVVDAATMTIQVKETSDVQVRIVDAFGRVVAERIHAGVSGKQFLPFQAGNLANGMYTLVATANGQSVSKPFVIQH